MIYLICFAASSLFIFISERKKGVLHRFCLLIGILIPVILAALRSYDVGTDIFLYARQVFDSARDGESLEWMGWWNRTYGVEYGYLFLNYVVSRFTDKYAWQFFFVELFIMVFIYKAFLYFKENVTEGISISYMFLMYYLLMYNESLNLMRQSMAVAVTAYGFRYVYERKPLQYVSIVLLAMQFHITALLAVFIYPLYILVCVKRKYFVVYILLPLSVCSGMVLGRLIGIITNTGLFGDKFLKYFKEGFDSVFSVNQFVIRFPFIILFLYMAVKHKRKREYRNLMASILVLDLAFAELRGIEETLYRLSLYFSVYKCVMYPEVTGFFCIKNKQTVKLFLLAFGLGLWYYQIVLMNNGQTYPYALNPDL